MFDFIINLLSRDTAERGELDMENLKVKSGFDSSGMPYIDLTDRGTAIIIKEKLKVFKGI